MNFIRDVIFYGLLVTAPLLVGGVHAEFALAAAGLGLLLLAWELWRESRPAIYVSVPSVAFLLGVIVCALQLIPLPEDVVGLLSPQAGELFHEGWVAMFGESPGSRWRMLSLAPAKTAGWGLRWLALILIAVLAARRATDRYSVKSILRAVVIAGSVVAAVGFAQNVIGTERILFVYEPSASIRPWTTFVSGNHAAVFYLFCGLSAVALAIRQWWNRLPEALAAGCAAILFLWLGFGYQSTASVVAFLSIMTVFCALLVARDPRAETRHSGRALAVITGLLGLGTTIIGAQVFGLMPQGVKERLSEIAPVLSWEQWREELVVRIELIRAGLQSASEFWGIGAGGGATGYVLAPNIDWSVVRPASIPTVENELVGWLVEYGVLFGLGLAVLFVSYVWFGIQRFRQRRRFRYAVGLCTAVFAVIVAQFHFPLTALGIALPMVALMEVTLFPVRRSEEDQEEWDLRRILKRGVFRVPTSVARGGLPLVGIFFILFSFGSLTWNVDATEVAGTELSGESRIESGMLVRTVWLTPSDGHIYIRGAAKARARGESEAALRRAEYAFEVEPKANFGILLAREYQRSDRIEDAIDVYRKIFSDRYDAIPPEWISEILVPSLERPSDLARALINAEPDHWHDAAQSLKETRGPSSAASLGLELADMLPGKVAGYEIAVASYLRMEQYILAELWARRLIERNLSTDKGETPAGFDLLLKVLRGRGEVQRAREVAVLAIQKTPSSESVALQVASVLTNTTDAVSEAEIDAVSDALSLVCRHGGKPWRQSLCWRTEGWLAEQRGELDQAGHAYRRIAEKLDQPRRYLSFLLRHDECGEMSDYLTERQQRRAKNTDDGRYDGFLERCLGD